MRDPSQIADGDMPLRARPEPRQRGFVQTAPGPELPDTREKAGAQAGMALALTAGGAFWAIVGVAAFYVLRH